MTGTGELRCPEHSFSYSHPGVKTWNVTEVPATPGLAWPLVAEELGFLEFAGGSGKAENHSGNPGNLSG